MYTKISLSLRSYIELKLRECLMILTHKGLNQNIHNNIQKIFNTDVNNMNIYFHIFFG